MPLMRNLLGQLPSNIRNTRDLPRPIDLMQAERIHTLPNDLSIQGDYVPGPHHCQIPEDPDLRIDEPLLQVAWHLDDRLAQLLNGLGAQLCAAHGRCAAGGDRGCQHFGGVFGRDGVEQGLHAREDGDGVVGFWHSDICFRGLMLAGRLPILL